MMTLKTIAASVAVTTLAVATLGGGSVSATSSSATCSQDTTAITASNSETLFVAPPNANWTGVTTIGPIAVNIPAGNYTVEYASYDDHSASPNEGQTQEQWFIQGFYQGQPVYTSEGTVDLPENQDTINGVFGSDVAVPQIDSIVMQHILDVDVTGKFPQSVVPACVSFTPTPAPVVEEPAPQPQVLAAVEEVVEEEPTLADTGVSHVLTMATGVALMSGATVLSRKQ